MEHYDKSNYEEIDRLKEVIKELVEALTEVAKGEGDYSRDKLTHAENTIMNMKEIANAAIAKATGE